MPSRREFCVRVGTTATGLSVLGAGTASAEGDRTAEEHLDAQPDHVTIEFDRDLLEAFQPLLVYGHLKYQPNALYAWVARSTQRDTMMAVYWAEYDKQEGLTVEDSHLGDHEPVYVEIDEATGQVLTVMYSAYHWLSATVSGALIPLYEDTHPQLHAVKPWHQFRQTAEEGAFLSVKDFTKPIRLGGREYDSVFAKWLVHDKLADSLQPGTTTNPWSMYDRDHWWRDLGESFGLGFAPDALQAKLYYRFSQMPFVDRGGASESDALDI